MALGNEQPKKYRTFNLGKCYMGGVVLEVGGWGGGFGGDLRGGGREKVKEKSSESATPLLLQRPNTFA